MRWMTHGRVADAAGIQFSHAQSSQRSGGARSARPGDRKALRRGMQAAIARPPISAHRGEADDLIVSNGRVTGLRLADGVELGRARCRHHHRTFLRDYPSWRKKLAGRPRR